MSTFQSMVMERLEQVRRRDVSVTVASSYANQGKLIVHHLDALGTLTTLAVLTYHFQPGHNKVNFNGAELGDHDNAFLFKEEDDEKINKMFKRWREVVLAEYREKKEQMT